MDNSTITSYNSTTQVFLPTSTVTFAIDNRDWMRLKKTVNDCRFNTNLWEVFASIFCGGSLSGFITWISLPNDAINEKSRIILLCIAVTCALISIVCFIASRSFIRQEKTRIESIKKELLFIEDKRPPLPTD